MLRFFHLSYSKFKIYLTLLILHIENKKDFLFRQRDSIKIIDNNSGKILLEIELMQILKS